MGVHSKVRPEDIARWSVVESDDLVVIVGDCHGDEVWIWFDTVRKGWNCDVCGQHSSKGTPITCEHVQAATRGVDLATLTRISNLVHRPQRPASASAGEHVAAERFAEMLARSAGRRAEAARIHDEKHQRIAAPVSVRRVSAADRRRLEETRRRRARTTSPWGQTPG